MRNSTKGKRLGAIAAAVAVVAVMLLCLLVTLTGAMGDIDLAAAAIIGFYALLGLAVVAGVIAALCQRLREIKGGEEEDAKKY